MDTGYDNIPVLYKNKVCFIDAVTRQTSWRQIPIFVKLGSLHDNRRNGILEYSNDLTLHTHCAHSFKIEKADRLLQNRLSSTILQREKDLKVIYSQSYTRCR